MTKEITGAEILLRSLAAEGVDTIFGYPGGAIMPVFDALYDYTRGEKKTFNHILVRHEQAAAHAAEGYSRVSGKVGVCIVTSGPGATNTITGVADALMDSTPMVVIAGQVGISALGTDAFQEVDLACLAQPICKWSYQIRHAEDIAWAISRAFYIAKSGRPGPVVIDFPKNIQLAKTEYRPQHVDFIRSYNAYPKPDMGKIEEAAKLIDQSVKPMALVGHGVEIGNAQEELKELLEKADIPAARTLMGLSALPSSHPLNTGMLGMHGNYAPNIKQQECDLLIAIGMRFSDRITSDLSTYAKQAKVIHIDIDASEIDKNVKTDVAIIADCKEALPEITRRIRKNSHKEWRDSFKPLADMEYAKVIKPATHPEGGMLLMGEVVSAVAKATQGEAVLVNDVGQNQMFSSRYFTYKRPLSIVTSGGLGTMGFGLPAAVGATFGTPNRTICLFTGDGGLQMNIQELGTIMEQQAPVKIILLNNNYLGNVRQWQDMFFGGRKSFTKMKNPQYKNICEGYHIPYGLAITHDGLKQEIEKMLATEGPYLLECAIKEEDNVMPMIPPGQPVDKMILEFKKEENNEQ